jgi:hypothetical protein
VVNDDVLFGVHPSTYFRWRGPVLRSGLEMLRPRERRPLRMPNQTSQLTEQRSWPSASLTPGSARDGSARPSSRSAGAGS